MRKYETLKLVTRERRRNYLASEPNYHTTKFSTDNLMTLEMRKTQILTSKPIYLGLSMLDLNKSVMYKFWYDYLKPKDAKKCAIKGNLNLKIIKTV